MMDQRINSVVYVKFLIISESMNFSQSRLETARCILGKNSPTSVGSVPAVVRNFFLCLMRSPISLPGLKLSGKSMDSLKHLNIQCRVNSVNSDPSSLRPSVMLPAQHSFAPFKMAAVRSKHHWRENT